MKDKILGWLNSFLVFDTFLDRFMPDNGHALPTTFAAHEEIPSLAKEKLMGSEGEVCKEIVRLGLIRTSVLIADVSSAKWRSSFFNEATMRKSSPPT